MLECKEGMKEEHGKMSVCKGRTEGWKYWKQLMIEKLSEPAEIWEESEKEKDKEKLLRLWVFSSVEVEPLVSFGLLTLEVGLSEWKLWHWPQYQAHTLRKD